MLPLRRDRHEDLEPETLRREEREPVAARAHLVTYDDEDPMLSTDVNVARHGAKSSTLAVVNERVVPPPFPMRPRAPSEPTWLRPAQDFTLPPPPPQSIAQQPADFDFSEFDPAYEDEANSDQAPVVHEHAVHEHAVHQHAVHQHAVHQHAVRQRDAQQRAANLQTVRHESALPFAATQLAHNRTMRMPGRIPGERTLAERLAQPMTPADAQLCWDHAQALAATQLAVPFVMPSQSERASGVHVAAAVAPAPVSSRRRGLRRTIAAGLLSLAIGGSATAAWCGMITEQDVRYAAKHAQIAAQHVWRTALR